MITTEDRIPAVTDHDQLAVGAAESTRTLALCALPTEPRSVPATRRFVRAALLRWAVPPDAIDTLLVVLSELATNVVLHSGSTEMSVLVRFDGTALTVEVKDQGRWLVRHTPRRAAEDDDAAFGRGLALVAACTSWWTMDITDAGTRVTARCPVVHATDGEPGS